MSIATLFLTCGPEGVARSTWARRLERQQTAVRLSVDDWLQVPYPGRTGPQLDVAQATVERLLWAVALRALQLGCNVVLDQRFDTRRARDRHRREAQALGARVVLCLLSPPVPGVLEAQPGPFEEPGADELSGYEAVLVRPGGALGSADRRWGQ
jgi:predicted kinase